MTKRRLIPYAGYEPPMRMVPVRRAQEMRDRGMGWKIIAQRLSEELNLDEPFTADGVYAAVHRRKKELV